MAEPINIQDLIDGRLDIQSLGEAANGDENTTVVTRTGETYPSAKKAINAGITKLFEAGGLPAKPFPTLAKMQAEGVILAENALALVYDELVNNGLYEKKAGAWIRAAYDPLTQAKTYSDSNAMFNPTVNPDGITANNAPYGLSYFSQGITLANGFPVEGSTCFILTYRTTGSSVQYQKAFYVSSVEGRTFERYNSAGWGAWVQLPSASKVIGIASHLSETTQMTTDLKNKVFAARGKNLFNKAAKVVGEQWSPSNNKVISTGTYTRSEYIPVVEGETYTLSGNSPSAYASGWFASNTSGSEAIAQTNARTFTAPAGAKYVVFNLTNVLGDNSFDDTTQFEKDIVATAYEPYRESVPFDLLEDNANILRSQDILETSSFNRIDPSKVNFVKRYSAGTKNFVQDALPIAASDWIPVKEGEWYVISGEGVYGVTAGGGQGGYFTEYGKATAIDNINFVAPVDGNGHAFKVPTGKGITHVVVSLNKTAGGVLTGNAQLQKGEQATAYQPYSEKFVIRPELIEASSGGVSPSAKFDDATWYNYTHADGAKIFQDKLPKFRKAMLLKDEDVVVVNSGTSLTARTSEHSTLRDDAAFRPPMMHSNAFCSHVWDALKWEGQQYRRYDSAYFTEVGNFNTSSSLTEWDDGAYRDGLTRYSTEAAAAVSFVVPVNAWQFNFIYRTDSLGCDAKVSVAEGIGMLQVFDETNDTWVEAHNYAFSQLEATPVTRTINIPSTVTAATTAIILASKGNTTYQKRLKMRCRDDTGTFKSLDSVKNVTISRTGGGSRFMYWGVEWSPRQYMVTYINAARGSHNTSATGATGLPRFQDNEIWGFKPTLILSELGIHNDGAAAAGVYPVGNWAGLAHNYVTRTDYELSMFSRAAHFGNTDVEYAFFTASIAWNFNGIEEDGSLKHSLQSSSDKGKAKMMSALDKYQEASEYLNSVGIPCIDAAYRWVVAGNTIFGDLKSATIGSGKVGQTFTNEGSHWNDTGSKIMAKAVIPII